MSLPPIKKSNINKSSVDIANKPWKELLEVTKKENQAQTKRNAKKPKLDDFDHKKVLEDMKLHNRAGMSCIIRPPQPKQEPATDPQNEDDRTAPKEEVYEFGNRGDVYRYLHLNKGLRSFKDDYLSCSEEELGKKTDMRGFEAYRDVLTHKKKFDEYRFKWESQSPEVLMRISELIHGFNQIETPLFLQIVNPEIFQSMFPVQLISRYLQTPFKDKGPGDELRAMEVRKLQTDLARLFLLFHLKADTKNHIRTDSDQLSIIDPITRSYLRMKNRSDDALKMKYMSKDFDIKIFIKDCIKTFFHALGFLEIAGYDFYLQSTILEILRYTLELGLWNYDEMRELVSLLFEKIQSLISVDQKYLADIVQHQSSERISSSKKETEQERCSIGDLINQTSKFTEMLNDCREQCAAICLQVIFLINDEEVKEAFESTTGRYNPKDSEYADKAWEFGYFKNIEFNYLINSIFTLFIIKFEPSGSTTDLANMANQILLIITDRSNDEYLNSMDMMDEATFDYIQELSHAVESTDPFSKPGSELDPESVSDRAKDMRTMLIKKLNYITTELALVNLDPKPDLMKELTDIGDQLKDGWEKALNDFDPEQLKKYKMALACENVPTLVISLANIVVETTNSFGPQQDICQPIVDFFVNICSKNDIAICLLFCYSSIDKMKAWMASDPIKIPYVLKYVLGSDETSPYQLLYSHTSVFESILGCYRATIALFEESLGGEPFDAEKYCEYWSKLDTSHIDKQEELQEKSMQHDLLLSIYLYNTMFIDLIRKGNKDFQSKYYDLQMAKEVFKMMMRMKNCFNKNQESQEVHTFIREDLERAKLEKTMIPPLKNYDRLSKEEFIFYFDTQFRERLDQEKQTISEGQDPQKKKDIQDSIQIKWMVIAVFRSTMDLFVKSSQRCFLPSVGQEGHKAFIPEIQFDLLDNNTIGLLRLSSSYLQLKASINMSIVSGSLFMPKTWFQELADLNTEEHKMVYMIDFSVSCLDVATKELQNLKTIKWESIYSEAQDQAFRESINKTFRIYLFEGLLPLIYKNCMFFLHYCRTDDFDIFKLMREKLGKVFEAFFLEFYQFRKFASRKEENWAKRNLLFDHNQLNTLGFISNLENESGGYALRLRKDSLEEIMKRREMVDEENRREKSDKGGSESKIGLHCNRSVKEGALKPSNMLMRNSEKAAEKYKKPGVSKNQKLDQISSMVNTKLMMKNQSRKLTKEELLGGVSKQNVAEEYFGGLEEDDRIYAEIEAFKILFQDIAEYIEFNYAQHDLQLEKTNQADLELMKEKLKKLSSDRKLKEDEKRRRKRPVEIELKNKTDSLKYETYSHILKMYQKELPVNQYSVKYLIFQDVNLNDCSSIALEKFYRDKKNVHKQVDDKPPKELFLRYKHLTYLYQKKKREEVQKGARDNHFIRFLKSQKGKGEAVIFYILRIINFYCEEELKRKQKELDKQERGAVDDDKWYDEYILIGLLTNEHVFSLNIFLDNMFFEYEFFIQCLLNLVTGGYKEFEDLTKHANRVLAQFEDAFKNQEDNTSKDIVRSKLQSSIGDIKDAERDYTKKMKTLSRKFLSLHYFMIKSLGRSCAAKFFIDHNWRNLWDRYYVSTNIFKNICESNNQTFKVFLSDFKPKFGSFNFLNKDTTVIEEFFTHLRPIMMNSKFWVNTATKEMPSDQVEKLPLVFRYMELLSVFVNEGCLRNQSILFMLGERYWQGIMQRMPDDIHSSIYQLKVSTVKFLIALIDKSSEIITNYMGYHFPPSYISELIYVHMKKLFCAGYLENDHTKLAMIREKGESEAFKKLSESQQERMRYLKSIEVEVRNPATSHKEDLGGCFEISEEVASEIRIDSFEQMKEVYLSSTQMYGHPLMELSFQLTKFMNAMAQLSPVYRLYVDYLNTQVVNVYGAEAPGRIKKAAKIDIAYDFDRERRPENIEIHMAMASFTEVVEIENNHHVQPDTANGEEKEVKEQPATIENSFIRPPESFMLTEQTKERILRGVPVGQVVETIQHSLNKLHIEMRCRLGIRRKYKWLYVLGGDRIMDIHKKIVWFFSFAVNLLMGFKNQSLVEKTTQSLFAGTNPVELALEVLAVLSTVYSLLHLVIWTLNKYTEVVETVLYEYAMAEEALLTMARRKKSLIAKAITYFETMILKPFLTMSTPVMFILQALFNVLGLYVSEVFFTLNLWMVVLLGGRNESILVSIRDNWVKMGLTLAMTLFVTYSTGFIGTAAGSAKKCDTLWGCVTDVLGFGTGEGKSGGSEAIITNLIFGTVVASFTSQQTQDKEIANQRLQTCAICKLDREEFTKQGKDFDFHLEHEHNIWTPLQFLVRLKTVDPESLTPNELSAYLKFTQDQLSWLPSGMTGFLAKDLWKNREEIQETLTALMANQKAGIEEKLGLGGEQNAGEQNGGEKKDGEQKPEEKKDGEQKPGENGNPQPEQ